MAFTQEYPTSTIIKAYLTAQGVEVVEENDDDFYTEWEQQMWQMLNRTETAGALSVYADVTTSIKVSSGRYYWGSDYRYYAGSAAINPTDNDTTYVWMTDANTVSSATDATGWPATPHIKLAEVTAAVTTGIITNIVDRRPMLIGNAYPSIVCVDNAVVCVDNEVVTI